MPGWWGRLARTAERAAKALRREQEALTRYRSVVDVPPSAVSALASAEQGLQRALAALKEASAAAEAMSGPPRAGRGRIGSRLYVVDAGLPSEWKAWDVAHDRSTGKTLTLLPDGRAFITRIDPRVRDLAPGKYAYSDFLPGGD